MTTIQAQIIELFQTLPESEQRELVEHLTSSARRGSSFYEGMTPEQRTRLQEGIDQADRGEGAPAGIVLDRLAKRLGVPRA